MARLPSGFVWGVAATRRRIPKTSFGWLRERIRETRAAEPIGLAR